MKSSIRQLLLKRMGIDSDEFNILKSFVNPHYQQHNVARLAHLDSLGLPIANKRVLEFGAGIGDHSLFYLYKNCNVTATDGREELVKFIHERLNIKTLKLDIETDLQQIKNLEKTDIIHCYGILYHISNPAQFIEAIRGKSDMLFLETCVSSDEKKPDVYIVDEEKAHLSQATSGKGCRPSRKWLYDALKSCFKYVYLPKTQPKHPQFAEDWRQPIPDRGTDYLRCVFIASNEKINNDKLTENIPIIYEKW
jgi:cyclopropane fatty-acyl-phospholipid synthase-like methyltransferase